MLKPIWAEGILLTQQHFQLFEQYNEEIWRFYLKLFSIREGIVSLEISDTDLIDNKFTINQCQLIFREGILINLYKPISITLSSQKTLQEIFIYQENNHLITQLPGYPDSGEVSAFESFEEKITDKYDQAKYKNVWLVTEKLKLTTNFLECKNKPYLKIAELEFDGFHFKVKQSYFPPYLFIYPHNRLYDFLKKNIDKLKKYIQRLIKSAKQKFLLPNVLNATLFLEHLINLYLMIDRALACGYLADVVKKHCIDWLLKIELSYIDNGDIYAKNHFIQEWPDIFSQIFKYCEVLSPTVYHEILVQKINQHHWQAEALFADIKENLFAVFKIAKQDLIAEKILNNLMKISSKTRIELLLTKSISGLGLQHVRTENLSEYQQHIFKISKSGLDWQAIQQENILSIYIPEIVSIESIVLVTSASEDEWL